MIHTRKIERVETAHAMPTRQDVDLGVLQHVADVQRAGDVGWRDDDGEDWTGRVRVGAKQVVLDPEFGPGSFDVLGVVSLGDVPGHEYHFSCRNAGRGVNCVILDDTDGNAG